MVKAPFQLSNFQITLASAIFDRNTFNGNISTWNGILLPKLFLFTVRKKILVIEKKNLKFEAEGREFAKILRSLEQFIQTVKGQYNVWQQNVF